MLELRKEGDVAVVTMTNGANKQDVTFATTLNELVAEVEQDESIHALVIASSDPKNWSQGINVEWMMEAQQVAGGQDVKTFFEELGQVYTRLMLLPVPAIAAINGHAFGAGAFLATACDYRFMNVQRGFFCFPEIDLKMDFLPGIFEMLVHKLPDFKLPDLLFTGKHASASELEACFIVEAACDGVEATFDKAMAFAAGLKMDRTLIASYKRQLHGSTTEKILELNRTYLEQYAAG